MPEVTVPVARPRAVRGLLLALAAALASGPGTPPAAGQGLPSDPELRDAAALWQEGRYDEALEGYLAAMEGPGGEALVEPVARLTGEAFVTTEVAEDGARVAVSPYGRWGTFEVAEDGRDVTRVVDLDAGGRVVATLPGTGVAFRGPDRAVFLRRRETAEVAEARRALAEAEEAGDRSGVHAARDRLARAEARATDVVERELPDGRDRALEMAGWAPVDVAAARGGALLVTALDPAAGAADVLELDGGVVTPLGLDGLLTTPVGAPGGRRLAAVVRSGEGSDVVLVDAATGERRSFPRRARPAFSADGSVLAMTGTEDGEYVLDVVELREGGPGEARTLVRTPVEIEAPAPSPDGRRVAYQKRPVHDWEVFVAPVAGGQERQVTWEIQHDIRPTWIDSLTLMAFKGEGRHRRAFLYDLSAGGVPEPVRLHHNNTVRTIAPEYDWAASPDGDAVLLVSERDGDTVSPERGVYLVELDRRVGRDALVARLREALAAERDLRARGARTFAPVADEVRDVVEEVSEHRVYQYATDLYRMGTKFIGHPGNLEAIEYIAERLREWGYEPELQWFEPRGLRSANVIARLPGTVEPDVVYVASSHFDSVERGPGADDDSSGTTALLEAARVMKDHPMPATIEFAFFTGEEAGLRGSREYVRRAVESGKQIVGALNNDMVGWSDGPRLDNTIRYSNPGIRDVQHAAAFLFTDLITYDALYYKSTDAHAYYEEYGDIVGGIGSYPVLGNPHYHQFTDRLNTVNHRLVAEVSKTTVATLMLLTSVPSRVAALRVRSSGGGVRVSWDPSPEASVAEYVVRWTDRSGDLRSTRVEARDGPFGRPEVRGMVRPSVALEGVAPGSTVSVKAVDRSGRQAWDWAHVSAPR